MHKRDVGIAPTSSLWKRDVLLLNQSREKGKKAEDEARTRDPQLGKLMLCQLSYFRVFAGPVYQELAVMGQAKNRSDCEALTFFLISAT